MSTFITRMDSSGSGPRLAVKDLIDVAGVPTTAGCKAVADLAQPAARDAACLAGARAADARIVGKTNLTELAMTPIGVNPWFGTPVNPIAPDRVPGGSSSGSAAAVGADEADVAYGSDTGGSVRIPAACCGLVGLKTTFGRIPLDGVWPLGATLDTVGPLARDVTGIELGMRLLEPGFAAGSAATTIGRIPTMGDPIIETAIDDALRAAGFEVVVVELAELVGLDAAFATLYFAELWDADHELLENHPEGLGADVTELLTIAPMFASGAAEARASADASTASMVAVFDRVELLALPTLPIFPPRLDDPALATSELVLDLARHTPLANVTGLPALALPVPTTAGVPMPGLPASLQLIGPHQGEELLVATGAVVEAAVG
ncbi:MAG TPA: amidase [Acidimicrobiales bacterium]